MQSEALATEDLNVLKTSAGFSAEKEIIKFRHWESLAFDLNVESTHSLTGKKQSEAEVTAHD